MTIAQQPTLATIASESDLPEGYCMMSIPDETGDTRSVWNPNDVTDVDMARAAFNQAKSKGMTAFNVDPSSGEKSGQMREFDPTAGKVIFVKQLQGG